MMYSMSFVLLLILESVCPAVIIRKPDRFCGNVPMQSAYKVLRQDQRFQQKVIFQYSNIPRFPIKKKEKKKRTKTNKQTRFPI